VLLVALPERPKRRSRLLATLSRLLARLLQALALLLAQSEQRPVRLSALQLALLAQ
jgi:hypothetical protein